MLSKICKPVFSLFLMLTPKQKKGGIICVIVMMILAFSEIIAASLIVAIATQITSPDGNPAFLAWLAIGCLVVFILKGIIALTDSYVQNRWIQTLILDFKKRLITRYTQMDYAHQVTMNSSRSLSVLYNDADVYMRMGLTSVGVLLSETTVFFVLMCFLMYLQPVITIILLGMFSLFGLVFVKRLMPVFKVWGKIVQETVQAGYEAALLILQSYKDILIFGKTDYFVKRYMDQSVLRAQVAVKAAVSQVIPRVSLEIVFILFFVGLVLAFLWTGNEISNLATVLSAYLYAGFRLLPSLNRMIIQINSIKMSEASIERIVSEMQSPYHKGVYVSEPQLTFDHKIGIQNVSFSYPNKEKTVLDQINLEISKGEFIGIIGETGSGKSTLLHLILGLLLPSNGDILIDGKYIASSCEWHSKIGYAAQDFHLIDGSIADNIAFGVSVEDRDIERVKAVIKDAQLDRFVDSLPGGLETTIGEKGVLISGGERQRIALARALYPKPEILMLDEATSALDLDTEKSIMDAVITLKDKDMTIIAVTHRLDTLKKADRVITIEKGQITKDKKGKKDAA